MFRYLRALSLVPSSVNGPARDLAACFLLRQIEQGKISWSEARIQSILIDLFPKKDPMLDFIANLVSYSSFRSDIIR